MINTNDSQIKTNNSQIKNIISFDLGYLHFSYVLLQYTEIEQLNWIKQKNPTSSGHYYFNILFYNCVNLIPNNRKLPDTSVLERTIFLKNELKVIGELISKHKIEISLILLEKQLKKNSYATMMEHHVYFHYCDKYPISVILATQGIIVEIEDIMNIRDYYKYKRGNVKKKYANDCFKSVATKLKILRKLPKYDDVGDCMLQALFRVEYG